MHLLKFTSSADSADSVVRICLSVC